MGVDLNSLGNGDGGRLARVEVVADTDQEVGLDVFCLINGSLVAEAAPAVSENPGRLAPNLAPEGTLAGVPAPKLGAWEPLSISRIVEIFAAASFRWWVGGGKALELHLGRSWREHDDVDIGVVRYELDAVYSLLSSWDLYAAAGGKLSAWSGERLEADKHQNNVWCRLAENEPWLLDLTIGDGTDDEWIYRRDRTVRRRWEAAVLRTADSVPYLAPELQLLFKSKDARPKDDIDAAEVIPALDDRQREFLRRLLEPEHPWRRRLL